MMKLRRPTSVYVFQLLWIVFVVFRSFESNVTLSKIIWIGISVISLFSLINMVLNRSYFEVREDYLLVNKDFFQQKKIYLSRIEKIVVESSFFRFSRISIKNGTEIKFNAQYLDFNEFKDFIARFNIVAEYR